ncbi:MAG: hypothetical protein HKM93_17740 [Desulfobacteraceae bacterium]|nr:hypothetical protein [Desulfobacteraceae bacterium]
MPYFSIETNKVMTNDERDVLAQQTSHFIADLLGKPEQYVMIAIKPGTSMSFGGDLKPAAFVELKSIGLPVDRCSDFAWSISNYLQEHLGIVEDRVFIDFKDLQRNLFAWNGKTF